MFTKKKLITIRIEKQKKNTFKGWQYFKNKINLHKKLFYQRGRYGGSVLNTQGLVITL